jgi:hypothetical protein
MANKYDLSVLDDIYSYAQAADDEPLYVQVRAHGEIDGGYITHLSIVILRQSEVIVHGSVQEEVGELIPDTTDELGLCLKRIPIADVQAVLTREEVDVYDMCMAADQSLLDNAY